MIDYKIEPLFATPLYCTGLQREITKDEKNFIYENAKKVVKNRGNNYQSSDNYILENQQLQNLKKFFNVHINNYFSEVLQTQNKEIPYITQSWINYNNINSHHDEHSHPNSIISGVFYIKSKIDKDSIVFSKEDNVFHFGEAKSWNIYNSTHWTQPVEKGLLLIFPSTLRHRVLTHKHNYTRISLSFNVFAKGIIGEAGSYTELIIKDGKKKK